MQTDAANTVLYSNFEPILVKQIAEHITHFVYVKYYYQETVGAKVQFGSMIRVV